MAEVLAIGVQFVPSVDCSHLTIDPIIPLTDNDPLFCPEQTEADPDKVPPLLCGVTLMVKFIGFPIQVS